MESYAYGVLSGVFITVLAGLILYKLKQRDEAAKRRRAIEKRFVFLKKTIENDRELINAFVCDAKSSSPAVPLLDYKSIELECNWLETLNILTKKDLHVIKDLSGMYPAAIQAMIILKDLPPETRYGYVYGDLDQYSPLPKEFKTNQQMTPVQYYDILNNTMTHIEDSERFLTSAIQRLKSRDISL